MVERPTASPVMHASRVRSPLSISQVLVLDLTKWYRFIVPAIEIYKSKNPVIKKRSFIEINKNSQLCTALGYAMRGTSPP